MTLVCSHMSTMHETCPAARWACAGPVCQVSRATSRRKVGPRVLQCWAGGQPINGTDRPYDARDRRRDAYKSSDSNTTRPAGYWVRNGQPVRAGAQRGGCRASVGASKLMYGYRSPMAADRAVRRRSAGHRCGSTQLESPTADPLLYPVRPLGGGVQQPGAGTLCRLYTAEIAAVSNSSSEGTTALDTCSTGSWEHRRVTHPCRRPRTQLHAAGAHLKRKRAGW